MAECRSNDCNKQGEFRVKIEKPDRPTSKENWEGDFCAEHLMRCLPLKLAELRWKGPSLEIRRA